MIKIFFMLFLFLFYGCKKEEIIVPDFIEVVPDARFVGSWYEGGNKNDSYDFSNTSNIGKRFVSTGSAIISFKFYWRKSSTYNGYESKILYDNEQKTKDGEGWSKFELEFISEKQIKINKLSYVQ